LIIYDKEIICLGLVSTVVADSPFKIFLGGLPNYLNDDQVSLAIEFLCFLINDKPRFSWYN
jgi:hypothetical protein